MSNSTFTVCLPRPGGILIFRGSAGQAGSWLRPRRRAETGRRGGAVTGLSSAEDLLGVSYRPLHAPSGNGDRLGAKDGGPRVMAVA